MQTKNNATIIGIILAVLLALFLGITSCNSPKWIAKRQAKHCALCNSKDTIMWFKRDSLIVKDTTFTLYSDVSMIEMLLKCDSQNQVYIAQMNSLTGKVIKPSFYFKHDTLKLECKIDSMSVTKTWIEHNYRDFKKYVSTKTIEVNVLTKLQRAQITMSWIFLVENILFLLFIIYLILKKFKIIKI